MVWKGGVVQADADRSDSAEPQPESAGVDRAREMQARALEAHQRLLDGDPVASADLCELLLGPLVGALRRRWPDASYAESVYDSAVDALIGHFHAPGRYDQARATLLGWLVWQANADLINDYHAAQRRFDRDVVTQAKLRNDNNEARLAAGGVASDRYPVLEDTGVWRRIRVAFPDRQERELIWRCCVEGERSTKVAAQVLGLSSLPLAEQHRQVKNVKDRIMKKLQRMGLADEQD